MRVKPMPRHRGEQYCPNCARPLWQCMGDCKDSDGKYPRSSRKPNADEQVGDWGDSPDYDREA